MFSMKLKQIHLFREELRETEVCSTSSIDWKIKPLSKKDLLSAFLLFITV
jgi:hypothetical protein